MLAAVVLVVVVVVVFAFDVVCLVFDGWVVFVVSAVLVVEAVVTPLLK